MKLIICVDDKNGMMFNHRRQSRDRLLIERLLEATGDAVICIKEYSSSLFKNALHGVELTQEKIDEEPDGRLAKKLEGKIDGEPEENNQEKPQEKDKIRIVEGELDVGSEEYFFDEDTDPTQFMEDVTEVIVYRWNKVYPADILCTADFTAWSIKSTYEFAGASHDKITEETFVKE